MPGAGARYGHEAMSRGLRSTLLDPRVQDGALASVLAAFAVLDVAVSEELGPRPVVVAAALLVTLPVAVRRRRPLGALAVALSALVAQALADGGLSEQASLAIPALILIYTVASHRAGRQAVLGLVVPIGALWAATFVETQQGYDHGPGDYGFGALSVVAVWLFGYALRGRARRISGLEDENVRLAREREERARVAVAEERARIARDLHDVVAHNVSVMVVQAAAAEEVLARDPERARAPLIAIQETGAQALTEMRRMLGILRAHDDVLAPKPALAGLDALIAQFREAGLSVELAVEGDRHTIPAGVDLAAYRIVEEALTNALKHAGGAPTRVSVRHANGVVELEIEDDGPGPGGGDGAGHGLIGMRERAGLYGGTLEAGSRPGGGFSVHARLPLASA